MSGHEPVRIAMWSGPRNISTAMMRAFENRADCAVSDEPFYAAYLAATGLQHPMRDAVIASQPKGWRDVAHALLGPVPMGRVQPGEAFRVPLEVGIRASADSPLRIEPIELTGSRGRFLIDSDREPASVTLDPNLWVLMEARLVRKP